MTFSSQELTIKHYWRGEGETPIERFWSRVAVTADPEKCWEWHQARRNTGYGVASWSINGKIERLTHRISFFLSHGFLPADLMVCHTCDNPPCVNPRHLFLGTQGDNQRDASAKGRRNACKGERHPLAKLNEIDVAKIRFLLNHGVPGTWLSKEFHVSTTLIQGIKTGDRWPHVAAQM